MTFDGLVLGWVLENTIVCSILAAIVWAVCRYVRPRAALAHALWLCVAIKLVTPPFLLWSWFAPSAWNPAANPAQVASATGVEQAGLDEVIFGVDHVAAGAGGAVATAATTGGWIWVAALAIAWVAGALVILFRAVRDTLRFRAVTKAALPAPLWIRQEVRRLCSRLGLVAPPIVVVPELTAPCTGGVGRARVFWSPRLLASDQRRRVRAVLGHELAHLKRRDHVVAHFELLAGIVWWWHPLFWFVRRQMHEYSEQACDLWALELGRISPREYADTLLDFSTEPSSWPALAARGSSRDVLRRRLLSVMRGHCEWRLSTRSIAGIAAGLALLLPSWTCREAPVAQLWSASVEWFGPSRDTDEPADSLPVVEEAPPAVDAAETAAPTDRPSEVEAARPPANPALPAGPETSPTPGPVTPKSLRSPPTVTLDVEPTEGRHARETERTLRYMIRWRARRVPGDEVAVEIADILGEVGGSLESAVETLEQLAKGRDALVARIARQALDEFASRQ